MLSTAASRAKSIDVGSFGLAHQSSGLARVGELLPTDIRARDGSPLAPIAADPPRRDVPIGTLPSEMEEVSCTDTNSSPSTMTFGDPLAVSPSVQVVRVMSVPQAQLG